MFYKKLIPICLISLIPTIALSNPQNELDHELANDDLIFIENIRSNNLRSNNLTTVLRISRNAIQQENCFCTFKSQENVLSCESCSILPKKILPATGDFAKKGYRDVQKTSLPINININSTRPPGIFEIKHNNSTSYSFRNLEKINIYIRKSHNISYSILQHSSVQTKYDYLKNRKDEINDLHFLDDYYDFQCGLGADKTQDTHSNICPEKPDHYSHNYINYIKKSFLDTLQNKSEGKLTFWCVSNKNEINYPKIKYDRDECELSHKSSSYGPKRVIRYRWNLPTEQKKVCKSKVSKEELRANRISEYEDYFYVPSYCKPNNKDNPIEGEIGHWSITKHRYINGSTGKLYPPFIQLYVMNTGKNALGLYANSFLNLLKDLKESFIRLYIKNTNHKEGNFIKINVIDYYNRETSIDRAIPLTESDRYLTRSLSDTYLSNREGRTGLERRFFTTLATKVNSSKHWWHSVILTDVLPKRDMLESILTLIKGGELTYVYMGEQEISHEKTFDEFIKYPNFIDLSKYQHYQLREGALTDIILGIRPRPTKTNMETPVDAPNDTNF